MPHLPNLSMRLSPDAPEHELLFARQLGVPCVFCWYRDDQNDVATLTALRQRVESAGLTLWNIGNYRIAKWDLIHLNLPGRDEAIKSFCDMVRTIGAAGVRHTTFTWEASGVWSSTQAGESRGAKARRVAMSELAARPFSHGRRYSRDEIWDNFEYFLKRVIPVCEEADVRLALHPNDPPVDELGGVPCLIRSFDDYRRAFALADSPYLGMEFCCGCWLEGGTAGFGELLSGLQWCLDDDRVILVHFRNVSAPLPEFTETFLDNGYQDMYPIMRTLVANDFGGTVTLDHTPQFCPEMGPGAGTAYAIAYMRALGERAVAELGG